MTRADGRPRVHIWPAGEKWEFAFSPTGMRTPAPSPGAAVNAAIYGLDKRARKGVVVIVEPVL